MPAKKKTDETPEVGQKELQKKTDEAKAQGFYGAKVDPEENYAYSVAGVTEHLKADGTPKGE